MTLEQFFLMIKDPDLDLSRVNRFSIASHEQMKRRDILDLASYEELRAHTRPSVLALKEDLRLQLNDKLTLHFETRKTLIYQIQEILRVEGVTCEKEILEQLTIYNRILGSSQELAATLMIGIEGADERKKQLMNLKGLLDCIFLKLDDQSIVKASSLPCPQQDSFLAPVQFLRFKNNGQKPRAIIVKHPHLNLIMPISKKLVKRMENR